MLRSPCRNETSRTGTYDSYKFTVLSLCTTMSVSIPPGDDRFLWNNKPSSSEIHRQVNRIITLGDIRVQLEQTRFRVWKQKHVSNFLLSCLSILTLQPFLRHYRDWLRKNHILRTWFVGFTKSLTNVPGTLSLSSLNCCFKRPDGKRNSISYLATMLLFWYLYFPQKNVRITEWCNNSNASLIVKY